MSDLFEAKTLFAKALLACPSFSDRNTRNRLVQELIFSKSIQRSDKDFDDVLSIVNRALDHEDGIDELVSVAQEFEEGSIHVKSFTNAAENLKSIESGGKIGRRLELHENQDLQNAVLRDFLIYQLIPIIAQPLVQIEKPARIYRECLPVNRRGDYEFFPENLYRSLYRLFDTQGTEEGFGFGACVFACVFGEEFPSIWTEINHWIDEAISKMAWTFSRDTIEKEAKAVRLCIEQDEQVYMQVLITPLDAHNREIAADLYYWRREDQKDRSRHRIEQTTFAQLPDEIDARIDGPALIELFLPTELMHLNIEFANEIELCLLDEHKIVRRFADRQKVRKMTKPTLATGPQRRHYDSWDNRWKTLQQNNSLADLFYPIASDKLNSSSNRDGLKRILKRKLSICCTACDAHPENHAEELFREILKGHIESGVPIMFWPGKARKLDLEIIKRDWLCVDVYSLLTHLREIQLEYLDEDYERDMYRHNLFIIYDDPKRMLP